MYYEDRHIKENKPTLEESKEAVLEALTDEALATDELLMYVAMNELREKYNLKVRKLCTEFSFLQFLAIPDYLINSLIFICS